MIVQAVLPVFHPGLHHRAESARTDSGGRRAHLEVEVRQSETSLVCHGGWLRRFPTQYHMDSVTRFDTKGTRGVFEIVLYLRLLRHRSGPSHGFDT